MGAGAVERTAVLLTIWTLVSSCGAISVVPPEGAEATPPRAEVFVNACHLLERPEVEKVLGTSIQPPRLEVPRTPADGTTCTFTRGLNGDEVVLFADSERQEPQPIRKRGVSLSPVDGVAEHAVWSEDPNPCCRGGMLQAITAEGAYFWVTIYTRVLDSASLRRAGIELGRVAAQRLSERFPGRREALPQPTAPPLDPCRLVSVSEQVRELGWAGTTGHAGSPPSVAPLSASAWRQRLREKDHADGFPVEFGGGAAGGSWQCGRARYSADAQWYGAEFVVDIFKNPVAPSALAATPVRAIRELDRPAFVVDLPPPQTVAAENMRKSAVFFAGPKARLIALYLRDANLDAAAHERHLVALAKLVASRIGR